MPQFVARKWQEECLERFTQARSQGKKSFVLEACMGAGKSAMAAAMAKALLQDEQNGVDHVLVLVPWKSIQGDIDKGMMGAFSSLMAIDSRERFFTHSRRLVKQPRPKMEATVTLYHEVCNQAAVDVLRMWKQEGFRFALICDEIHHTNEINSSWGTYVEQIKELSEFSIFMSGTFFRSDKHPISCIPLDGGFPRKDYQFTYMRGVKEAVVRPVTTRDIDATVTLYNKEKDEKYEVRLSEIQNKELSEAKKQVLDPNGECVRHIIENVHTALMQTRTKFPDAACLFVCRPGGGDDFTRERGGEAIEDRNVHKIARQIEEITGESPTVVTHQDRDSVGKIVKFRRGNDPYLVAINMVSEGCDIPRLRAVAFCRYTTSEMLFRQIVGRALRWHEPEDGTAAQIYIPAFPTLVGFASAMYSEAQEGVRDRRCSECDSWPCVCTCVQCGKEPCECGEMLFPTNEVKLLAIDATPVPDGGHIGTEKVTEHYVRYAISITQDSESLRHFNHVQLGHALQKFVQLQEKQKLTLTTKAVTPQPAPQVNPAAERDRLRRRINRRVHQMAVEFYAKDYAKAYYQEVQVPFGTSLKVILNTWPVDKLREVDDRMERRLMERFRRG